MVKQVSFRDSLFHSSAYHCSLGTLVKYLVIAEHGVHHLSVLKLNFIATINNIWVGDKFYSLTFKQLVKMWEIRRILIDSTQRLWGS